MSRPSLIAAVFCAAIGLLYLSLVSWVDRRDGLHGRGDECDRRAPVDRYLTADRKTCASCRVATERLGRSRLPRSLHRCGQALLPRRLPMEGPLPVRRAGVADLAPPDHRICLDGGPDSTLVARSPPVARARILHIDVAVRLHWPGGTSVLRPHRDGVPRPAIAGAARPGDTRSCSRSPRPSPSPPSRPAPFSCRLFSF